jgi:DNA-binding transcriptional LysR family regulator
LSQQAASNAIKALEGQLGFALFERINNRLFPTQEAQMLCREADPIFALHRAFTARLEDLQQNKAGHLSIVATPPLAYGVIPLALRRFLARRPKVRVFFDVRRFEGVLANVEANVAELGFLLGLDKHPGLAAKVVHRGEMVCVSRRDHPLALKPFVTPADFAPYPFVALERGTRLGTLVRHAFAQESCPFNFSVEVRYCHTACVLAQGGVGVAVVDSLSAAGSGQFNLAVRRFRPATPVVGYAVHLEGRSLSRLATAFLLEVQRAAAAAEPQAAA